ncbi:hypothetical protein D3C80_1777130 [compost metagenome]
MHRLLLFLGILFEHIVQIALRQQAVHLCQRGRVNAILLFQLLTQVFIHPRRFWQSVVFIVMTLRVRQQVFRRGNQLAELSAVDLTRCAALQAEHAAVKGNARLVEADPRVGKFCNVLAGEL